MNFPRAAAIAATGLLALVGCEKPAQDTAADESAIRAVLPALESAYNAGDANAVAALYADDAVIQPPNAPAATGRAAIRDFIATDSANTKAAGLTLKFDADSTVGVSGDLGYEAGTLGMADATGAKVTTGKYIGIYQKQDGKWLLARGTWNMDAPPAPATDPAAEAPPG